MRQLVFCIATTVFVLMSSNIRESSGHGILWDPPQRSSMWRQGFQVPPNFDDYGLNCGGRDAQHNEVNQGRCGECGDEWSLSRPRENDEGGIYGTGKIGQTYTEGSAIRLTVNISANHLGYFEFRLCPKKSKDELVTQECLDQHLLQLVNQPGQGGVIEPSGTQFTIGSNNGFYFPTVMLPAGITCDYCVLQWYWTTANSPGLCNDGSNGYCYQESFVNCADVAILPR